MVSREALVRCGEKCVNKNHLRLTLRSGHSRQGMTTEGFFVVVVVVAIRSTLRSGHTRQGMTTEGFFVVVVVVAIRSTLRSGHTRQGMTTEGFFVVVALRSTLTSGHTRQGMTTDGFLLLLSSLTFSLPTMIINAFWCSFLPKHRNLKQNEVQSAGVDSSLC